MEQNKEMQTRKHIPRSRRQMSAFHRYRLGWVLLSMVVAAILVYLAGGDWGAMIILPLIVGAFLFRSALVEDYKRRQAEESSEQ